MNWIIYETKHHWTQTDDTQKEMMFSKATKKNGKCMAKELKY